MLEDYKNYCVIKTFGLLYSDVEKYIRTGSESINVDFSEDCLDGTLLIINKNASEIAFQKAFSEITTALSEHIYADYDTSLAKRLVETCLDKGIRLAVAESLTGGMVCSSIVDVPGASNVLIEGFVTYTNTAKVRRLHVKLPTIETRGAVSKEVAGEMTQGLLANRDIDMGIATTGCAGPDSDEHNTPVGLAFVGVATRRGGKIYRLNLQGERNYIRKCVANAAMFYALKSAENGTL